MTFICRLYCSRDATKVNKKVLNSDFHNMWQTHAVTLFYDYYCDYFLNYYAYMLHINVQHDMPTCIESLSNKVS